MKFLKDMGFKCSHCHFYVSASSVLCPQPLLSGVKNRNHCPYCLWSRHLDLYQAGDRLAACKARMKPVGLTLKRTRKKYGLESHGELMLIHLCNDCGKVSINRIAADDVPGTVFDIYESSLELDPQMKILLEESGIQALGDADRTVVHAQLFGHSSPAPRLLSPLSFLG